MDSECYVPSDSYSSISATSGSTFTAPGNGYVAYYGLSGTNAGGYMYNTVNGLGNQSTPWTSSNNPVYTFLPVKTGDTVYLYAYNLQYLRFIPFELASDQCYGRQ